MRNFLRIAGMIALLCKATTGLAKAQDTTAQRQNKTPIQSVAKHTKSPVIERAKKEETIPSNYFAITLYKPTYILPFYYTGSPDNVVYQGNTPNNEKLKKSEVKYQFSFKLPVWKNVFDHESSTLFLAYTQQSYWQLYNHRPFFRESDYEPEIFLANEINLHIFKNWHTNFLNVGAAHQSNGYGNQLERSWNRLYVEAISSTDNWMVSLKPWYIMSTNSNNNNIAHFLGYGRVLIGYKYNKQVFTLSAQNIIESAGKRSSAELTWSFPITPYIKGYAQLFSGYGQSLIEYNHRTNSAGIGITLSDWV